MILQATANYFANLFFSLNHSGTIYTFLTLHYTAPITQQDSRKRAWQCCQKRLNSTGSPHRKDCWASLRIVPLDGPFYPHLKRDRCVVLDLYYCFCSCRYTNHPLLFSHCPSFFTLLLFALSHSLPNIPYLISHLLPDPIRWHHDGSRSLWPYCTVSSRKQL